MFRSERMCSSNDGKTPERGFPRDQCGNERRSKTAKGLRLESVLSREFGVSAYRRNVAVLDGNGKHGRSHYQGLVQRRQASGALSRWFTERRALGEEKHGSQ